MILPLYYSARSWYLPTWIVYLLNEWNYLVQSREVTSVYHQEKKEILEEHVLIEKSKEDPRYFSGIYEKYYEPIFRFIYKRTDDEYVTADITSKVFFNCLKNLQGYKFQGVPFSSWLYKIAVNEVNQFYRARKNLDRIVSLEDHHVEQLIDEIEYKDPKLDPNILVTALLKMLKPGELQFLELRFFEGYSFKEVGYLTGLTEVNAKIKTYRILKKLKDIAGQIKYDD